ncbi:MAG: hypothetical protein IKR25_13385, partial [Muribaculaceae bacterium]|nr:hypothetical protein [Muribaculaceae bacterium]
LPQCQSSHVEPHHDAAEGRVKCGLHSREASQVMYSRIMMRLKAESNVVSIAAMLVESCRAALMRLMAESNMAAYSSAWPRCKTYIQVAAAAALYVDVSVAASAENRILRTESR